jgi:nucleoside phosphorylase
MKTLIIIPSIFEAEKLPVKTKFHEFTKISENLLLTISGIAKSGLKTIKDIVPKENISKMILIGMCGDLTDDNRIGDTCIIIVCKNKELTLT